MPKNEWNKYGMDYKTYKNLQSIHVSTKERNINPHTMPFGKYKGKLFGKIPTDYLEYILTLEFIDQTLKNRIECNIRYRK